MIYGVNFNNTHVPVHVWVRFAKERRSASGRKVRLQGVCNTAEERDAMLIIANNSHRDLCTARKPRRIAGEDWYPIYVG